MLDDLDGYHEVEFFIPLIMKVLVEIDVLAGNIEPETARVHFRRIDLQPRVHESLTEGAFPCSETA